MNNDLYELEVKASSSLRKRYAAIFAACLLLPASTFLSVAQAQSVAASAEDQTVVGNPPQTPGAPRGSQPNPTPLQAAAEAEQEAEEPAINALYFGGDLYYGRSNATGFRRLRDGFWPAGNAYAYPSILQLRLATRKGAEAKFSYGVGRMYRDDTSTLDQPHEAWYRTPLSGINLTVGKYYVPFALQEWQYETKWGAMVETERGPYQAAVSLNYNQNLNSTNAYARLGRNFGENINAGVSLGAGRGLSYDTEFNRAWGLDASASWKGFNFLSEYMKLRDDNSGKFRFLWLKLEYEGLGKLKPFIQHWRWSDSTDTFGSLRSNGIGASYAITSELALEGGLADTTDENVRWIQLHWTPEWRLWGDSGDAEAARRESRLPLILAPQPR